MYHFPSYGKKKKCKLSKDQASLLALTVPPAVDRAGVAHHGITNRGLQFASGMVASGQRRSSQRRRTSTIAQTRDDDRIPDHRRLTSRQMNRAGGSRGHRGARGSRASVIV